MSIALKSIWAAAELPATPPFQSLRWSFRADAIVDVLAAQQPVVDLLYLHPSGVASVLYASDGYVTDTDKQSDGTTTVAADRLTLLSRGQGKHRDLAEGGVLILLDVDRMEVSVTRLTGALLRGAR